MRVWDAFLQSLFKVFHKGHIPPSLTEHAYYLSERDLDRLILISRHSKFQKAH